MYSTVNSNFHISIRINCNRISEGLLYFPFFFLFSCPGLLVLGVFYAIHDTIQLQQQQTGLLTTIRALELLRVETKERRECVKLSRSPSLIVDHEDGDRNFLRNVTEHLPGCMIVIFQIVLLFIQNGGSTSERLICLGSLADGSESGFGLGRPQTPRELNPVSVNFNSTGSNSDESLVSVG
jgi:hypothetical protein